MRPPPIEYGEVLASGEVHGSKENREYDLAKLVSACPRIRTESR